MSFPHALKKARCFTAGTALAAAAAMIPMIRNEENDMQKYKLKTPKAVEDTVASAYKRIENGVVGAYKKIEDKFVDTFLERVDESAAQPGIGPQE